MPDTPNKFYLTTPIYYVNARPHIGHAYSTIAADVIARRHRLLGDDTFFLTGTDEHGQKVQRSAEKAGIPPQQFTDEVSATFRDLWKRMGITNDDYIRTTEERHKRGVQHLWKVLEQNGAIYLDSYTGAYCVSDEAFVDLPAGTPCPDCGRPLEIVTEENYFFKLSEYQAKLIDLIESGTLQIQPETTKNEVLSFLRGGLKDLSISRTTFDWGIPVPGNPKHVIYVWLDALANYITAMGYGAEDRDDLTPAQKQEEKAKFEKYWPADIHLVGKEITRFHCVYWPAFLMAAGLPTPKSVVANGWLLFEESKMSKSRGNVVRTETILDAFGPLCPPVPSSGSSSGLQPAEKTPDQVGALAPEGTLAAPTKAQQDLFASDVIRYFLLREIPFGQDGSFSFDALITRYNSDLVNGYGNLVSRVLSMIQKYYDGNIPGTSADFDISVLAANWINTLAGFPSSTGYSFTKLLEALARQAAALDETLTSRAPWKIATRAAAGSAGDQIELAAVLYNAAEFIRALTATLYPIIPYATASVWRQLGLGSIEQAAQNGDLKNLQWGGLKPGTKLGPLAPIFPRADKGLAQTMTDMENPTTPPSPEPSAEAKASEPTAESLNAVSPSTDAAAPAPPTSNPAPQASEITIDDFAKIDLRVAQIVVAERIPKADKLLRLEVDLGPALGRRQILSGIAEFYTPEELLGKRIAIIANLAPRKMRGLESHGMLLAASADDHASKPILATFSDEVPLGSKIR